MDGLDIRIEGGSDTAVAPALPMIVMRAEGKDEGGADADWILASDKRCLTAVLGAFDPDEQHPEDSEEDEEAAD